MARHVPTTVNPARPGAVLKSLRIQKGWTLANVSERSGFPVSTLSKIENDRVSLSYDKLTRLSGAMEIDISVLFGSPADGARNEPSGGRRMISKAGQGKWIDSKNYLHCYPAAELLNKRLIPIVVVHKARSLEEFGELVRHTGEEWIYVLEGELDVYTSLYAPARLQAGDSIYIDSTMGHAYVAVGTQVCRSVSVCSGTERQLLAAIDDQAQASAGTSAVREGESRGTRKHGKAGKRS